VTARIGGMGGLRGMTERCGPWRRAGRVRGCCRGLPLLLAVVLGAVGVAGCQGQNASAVRRVRLVGAGPVVDVVVTRGGGLVASDGRDVFEVPAGGGEPSVPAAVVAGLSSGVNVAGRPMVRGLSRAEDGEAWLTLATPDVVGGRQVVRWPSGAPHAAMPQLTALLARGAEARPALLRPLRRARAVGPVVAADDQGLLAGTCESGLSTTGDGGDCQVWRLTGRGPVPVAGRVSRVVRAISGDRSTWRPVKPRPAAALGLGEAAPATQVDLERALAILPMPGGRVVVITQAPDDREDRPAQGADESGLVVLVVQGGTVRRIDASALRDDGRPPLLTRIDDRRVLLGSGLPSRSLSAQPGVRRAVNDRARSVIDLTSSTLRVVDSGPGLAVGRSGGYTVLDSPDPATGLSTVRDIELPATK
jgi:hypothetical protein